MIRAYLTSCMTLSFFRSAVLVILFGALAGCANVSHMKTGSVGTTSKSISEMNAPELLRAEQKFAAAYEANPGDKTVGINYATVLRMIGRDGQALTVMQQVATNNPTDREVLASYGNAQAAAGQLNAALETVRLAQTPDHPDWKLLSAEGAILDQLGRGKEARALYRKALEIAQNEPSVISNLGMSYLLAGDLRSSETYLRQAVGQPGADSRVRQNLALVVGLQGRFDEAQSIARAELSKEQADANVAYLETMLAQQNVWSEPGDKKKKG